MSLGAKSPSFSISSGCLSKKTFSPLVWAHGLVPPNPILPLNLSSFCKNNLTIQLLKYSQCSSWTGSTNRLIPLTWYFFFHIKTYDVLGMSVNYVLSTFFILQASNHCFQRISWTANFLRNIFGMFFWFMIKSPTSQSWSGLSNGPLYTTYILEK